MSGKKYVVQITEGMLHDSLRASGFRDAQITPKMLEAARKALMADVDPPRGRKVRNLIPGDYD